MLLLVVLPRRISTKSRTHCVQEEAPDRQEGETFGEARILRQEGQVRFREEKDSQSYQKEQEQQEEVNAL